MSAKKAKRLKIGDRVEIIQRLEAGEPCGKVAVAYGITSSAVSQMRKNKEDILKMKRMIDDVQGNPNRKRFTGIENSPLDRCLYDWYMEKENTGEPPSVQDLQEQARVFNKQLNGPETFKASWGFVSKFKRRYGIGKFANDEETSTKETASEKFPREFTEYIENHDYGLNEIYAVDETELSWKTLPRKRSLVKNELYDDIGCFIDDRVTIVACSNASGTHKLPLLVIGNSDHPRCLENIRSLPVVYRGKKYSWRNGNPILDWYREIFIPEITKKHGAAGEKCILLLASPPSLESVQQFDSTCDICSVTYVPPDVNSSIQPMSQGIIDRLKNIYKRKFLRFVLTEDNERDVEKLVRGMTLLHCCNILSVCWNEVTENDVKNAWNNIFPCKTTSQPDFRLEAGEYLRLIRRIPGYSETTLEETKLWLHREDNEPGWTIPFDEVLLNDGACNDENSMPTTEEENNERKPSAKNALQGLDCAISWYQTRWECSSENLAFLEKLRELAVTEILSNKV